MDTTHFYHVNLSWQNDRKGEMSSPVLNTTLEVATPPEFQKGMPGIWSPEHLLVAAVNSCLMTTFLAIAENSKVDFISFDSSAIGKLEIVNGKYMVSEITLNPIVHMQDGDQRERMERVLQKSEAACLITNSIKSKIIFEPEICIDALMLA